MALGCKSNAMKLLSEDSGQAATEYALAVMWTVIIAIVAIRGVETALLDFYQDTASVICLPIP